MGALMVTAVVVVLTTILVVMFRAVFSRASTARSSDSSDRGGSAVPNISPVIASSPSSSSSGSWKYDVFISFRGEDTRKTFVDHLYSALAERVGLIYKDDVTLQRGDTFRPSLFNAIQESHIALIIFSKNYADSSWCLDELAYIMECKEERGQIVIPIFYDVSPSDVRKQKGAFGQGFSKQELENNNIKINSWKKALTDASDIPGWELKHVANGHESEGVKIIVGTILDKLLSANSDVDDALVGMGSRFPYLESQLQIGSVGARVVGIWGLGGSGKTTLAYAFYKKICKNFQFQFFVQNISEESRKHGLTTLQEKILPKGLSSTLSRVENVLEGRNKIKAVLCHRKVLIVLDDVDDLDQLEALAGSHNWFGDGSLIIITTREKHLLTSHKVDKIYPASLLTNDEAIRLFHKYAYNEKTPVEDYDTLSQRVVSYAAGLPLAIKVLGSDLCGKKNEEWEHVLDKLKDIPERKVTEILKISYDRLEGVEKDLFLDIACFFRGENKDAVMVMLDACWSHADAGVYTLIKKSLITISSDGSFDMHDLIQDMGHYIVRETHAKDPEKHSRVWRSHEIEDLCFDNATTENYTIEAIQYTGHSKKFPKLVSNLKKLRSLLLVPDIDGVDFEGPKFFSNDLRSIFWDGYATASPFPKSFRPTKLGFLRLERTLQKQLWKDDKHLPCLKELILIGAEALVRTPDFNRLPCLQKLRLEGCTSLKEIHRSLGSHSHLVNVSVIGCSKLRTFPAIYQMENLMILEIVACYALHKFPKIEAIMDQLVNLHVEGVGIEVFPSSVGEYCTNLGSLKLNSCSNLKSIEGNFQGLKKLKTFNLIGNPQLENLPKDLFDESCDLEELRIGMQSDKLPARPPLLPRLLKKLYLGGFRLEDGEIPSEIGHLLNLQELHLTYNYFSRFDMSLSQLTQLKLLNLRSCVGLEKLPELPSSLAILKADDCYSLEAIGDDIHKNCNELRHVSIVGRHESQSSIVIGGEKLLETMLRGNQPISLQLESLEIPEGFTSPPDRGDNSTLQLPRNWHDDYSGFLLCAVLPEDFSSGPWKQIHEESTVERITWVGYIPFGMLRHTAWWNEAHESVTVTVNFLPYFSPCMTQWVGYVKFGPRPEEKIEFGPGPEAVQMKFGYDPARFGVRLVSKEDHISGQMEQTTTSSSQISEDYYTCNLVIEEDSKFNLGCRFESLGIYH